VVPYQLTEHHLRAGDYEAVVTARAGALRRLTYHGRDLVVPFEADDVPIPAYRGVIAAPWPNRIADGRYRFDGRDHQLPVNEPERACALHGLSYAQDWSLVSAQEDAVVLVLDLAPTEGYPFPLHLEARYALDGRGPDEAGGLVWQVTATNTGSDVAPYGVCPHPYLVAGPSPLDTWTLQLPADEFLEVTPDRLLPRATRDVTGHPFAFTTPKIIGDLEIDHAFTAIRFGDGDSDGDAASMTLTDPVGTGVGMAWDRSCPWLQVHTADRIPPFRTRLGLAVEPMTCPPDAFNSGVDLVRLAPGAQHRARWRIFALEG
jgi:aldose 1-epimerase